MQQPGSLAPRPLHYRQANTDSEAPVTVCMVCGVQPPAAQPKPGQPTNFLKIPPTGTCGPARPRQPAPASGRPVKITGPGFKSLTNNHHFPASISITEILLAQTGAQA